ncbi:MAG TPA: F0F1 ATP synthase subunit delta [Spirochaetia bacterium]|nr:F0F1 ATP synthase subunit delta [Spirochaetia bacterium]
MHFTYNARLLVQKLLEVDALDGFLDDMATFDLLCSENRNIENSLFGTLENGESKHALVMTIVAPYFGSRFSELLVRLEQNRDLAAYPRLALQIRTETARRIGADFAEVASAVPLAGDHLRRICAHLGRLSGRRTFATNVVSRDLIGGFVITVNGRRIDLSIRGDLLKMKDAVLRP